jgi:hypothetical protein
LAFEIVPDPSLQRFNQLESVNTYQFGNCAIFVHIIEVPSNTGYGGLLALEGNTTNRIEMGFETQTLKLRYWINDVVTEVAGLPFDPKKQIWWRLQENSGTTYFETSADGSSFETLGSIPTPFATGMTHIGLFGGATAGTAAVGEMRFDNMNGAP